MYDDWLRWTAELTREQFDALFSADVDASNDDFGGFETANLCKVTLLWQT